MFKGIGVPVITDYQIWKNNPEKVFGLTKEFTEQNPNTTLALTKALIRAAKWLDEDNNAKHGPDHRGYSLHRINLSGEVIKTRQSRGARLR